MEKQPNDDVNALEETPEDSSSVEPANSTEVNSSTPSPKQKRPMKSHISGLVSHLNIYLLLFILLLVLVGGFTFVSIQQGKKQTPTATVKTQTLSADDIKKLNSSDASIGDAKQTLSVESNAVFAGKVLIRDSLDIAGGLKVGGSLSLSGLNVAGISTFDQIQANKLSVSGDTNLQGQLTIQKGITVTGGGSFSGPLSAPQISVQNFQLSGDLQLQRHIDAGGSTPSKSDGGALGGGGTVSVSGTDTAGAISINTGSNPGAGCFVTVKFAQKFNSIVHVIVSPIGSGAAGLNYYLTRTASEFSVCTTNPAPSGANFGFDWIALD